jgi:hypothetical protein
LAALLTPCFYGPDSGEHEEAVKGSEMAWWRAVCFSICAAIVEIASAFLVRGLDGEPVSFRGDVVGVDHGDENITLSGWEWHGDMWTGMIALAIVALVVALAVNFAHCALAARRRLLILSILGVLVLVLTTTVIAVSATRQNVAYAFSDVVEAFIRLEQGSWCRPNNPPQGLAPSRT